MVRKNIPVNTKSKNLSILGGRLAYERERLKLTIVDFALQCGVTKQTQIKYEAGDNFPDSRYLERAAGIGADVYFILFGRRDLQAVSDEHQNLIEAYEDATPLLKRAAFAVLASPYINEFERCQHQPGYFTHEIKGVDEKRYTRQEELKEFGEPKDK